MTCKIRGSGVLNTLGGNRAVTFFFAFMFIKPTLMPRLASCETDNCVFVKKLE